MNEKDHTRNHHKSNYLGGVEFAKTKTTSTSTNTNPAGL